MIVLRRTGSGPRLPQPNERVGPYWREAYAVTVTSGGAEIRANLSAGLSYGVQTLLQRVEALTRAETHLSAAVGDDPPTCGTRPLLLPRWQNSAPTVTICARAGWRQNRLTRICPGPCNWGVSTSASRTSSWTRGCWITPE